MILAQGTVDGSQKALFTARVPTRVFKLNLHCTSGVTQTCTIYLTKDGQPARKIKTYVFTLNESGEPIGEIDFNVGDSIEGITTTDGAVDFTVTGVPLSQAEGLSKPAFRPAKYNSKGEEVILGSSSGGTGGGGNTGYLSAGTEIDSLGTVSFADSNGLAWGLNAQTMTGSYTVPSTAGLISNILVSAEGKGTQGSSSANLSALTFRNSNNVTIGMSGSVITASVAPPGSGSVVISAGTTNNNVQAFSLADSNGISWGINNSTVTASYAFNLSGGTTSNNLTKLTVSDAGGISWGLNASTLTAKVSAIKALGVSNTGSTAGNTGVSTGVDWVIAGTNMVTASESTAIGGPNTIWLNATQTVQTVGLYASGASTTGDQSSSTFDARSISISASGNVSAGFKAPGALQIVVPPQSNQTGNIYLSGTANTTAQSSSSSYDHRSLSISAAGFISAGWSNSSLVLSGTQAAIQSIMFANTTFTTGSVAFSNANGVSFGSNGGQVTVSFTSPVASDAIQDIGTVTSSGAASNSSRFAQEDHKHRGLFLAQVQGNTSGSAGPIWGSLILNAGNNITISGSTNAGGGTFTFNAAGGTGAVGIAGIANSQTTYTSGTVSLSGANAVTIRSSAGQIYQFDVPIQSVQTAQWRIDGTGGTIPGLSTITTVNVDSMRIRPVGAISAAFDLLDVIELSVAAQSNQSLGMYAIGNTTGDASSTTFDARTVSIEGDGIVTVGFKSPGKLQVSAVQSTQSAIEGLGVSNTGNTAGNTGISTGIDWVIAGSNGITASQSTTAGGPNTIWISGVSGGGGNVTLGISTQGNTSGTSGFASGGAVRYIFAGGNNITVSQSVDAANKSATLTISAFNQTNQSAIKGLGASNTGNTAGNTGLSTGIDWVLAGSNNVTISESTTAGGPNTLWVSGPTPTAQSNQTVGLYALGNTTQNSSTTLDARTLSFNGLGGMTVGYSNGSIQLSAPTTAAQTNQSIGFYGVGNTTQNSSTTLDARTVSFGGRGDITVGYSNGTIQISGTQTNQSVGLYAIGNTTQNSSTTLDARTISINGLGIITAGYSNGSVQLSATQSAQSVGLYALGNTTQNSSTTLDARTLSFNGLGGNTIGYSNGSIQVSGVTTNGLISAVNISGGTTSSNVSAVTFANSNALSFGYDGSAITGSWGFNVSAGTTSRNLTAITLVNLNNISFGYANALGISSRISASYQFNISGGSTSGNVNAVTFSDANGVFWGYDGTNVTANAGYLSYYENQPWLVATATQQNGNSTEVVLPFNMPSPGSFSYLRMPISMSSNSTSFGTTNTGTAFSGSLLSTFYAVVYSLGTGGNSRSLQYVTSGSGGYSEQLSFSCSGGTAGGTRWSISYKFTYPSEGASNSTFSTSSAASSTRYDINSESALSGFNGMRYLDIPFAASLSAGAYWLAFGMSSTTSTQSVAALTGAHIDYSNWGATQPNQVFGIMGSATNSSNMLQVGLGSFSTNQMTTSSIALSLISSSASHVHPYFQMIRQV